MAALAPEATAQRVFLNAYLQTGNASEVYRRAYAAARPTERRRNPGGYRIAISDSSLGGKAATV